MVMQIAWNRSYRVIASKYPTVSVYDRIVDTAHFAELLELEALTNPRVREEAGDFRKVRRKDFISGPNTTPIMASFVYSGNSRFSDGSYGVYYAAHDEETAIAESRYHTEQILRATNEPSIDLDKRVYVAKIAGNFEDVRTKGPKSRIYDPDSYTFSQTFARGLYEADDVDGILYRSVRRPPGECVCVFRPRLVTNCHATKYVQFRWDGSHIVAVAHLNDIRA
ncbi:MAG: RES family NAD+ phosphorylase [Vulcanimicrobiaceae bacterium]